MMRLISSIRRKYKNNYTRQGRQLIMKHRGIRRERKKEEEEENRGGKRRGFLGDMEEEKEDGDTDMNTEE